MDNASAIGVRRRRIDGEAMVLGATRYGADLPVHGLLHARLVLGADAHARVTGIDVSAALDVPGVVAVLVAEDLPLGPDAASAGRAGEPLAGEEILFAGQPVAVVLAESEAAAADGVDMVVVEAEPLEAVVDVEAGMARDAPRARLTDAGAADEDIGGAHGASASGESGGDDEWLGANVVRTRRLRFGDADGLLAGSTATAAGAFRTSWIHQGYLEPQVATAWVEPDGELVVHCATQGAFITRDELAKVTGLPVDRIRVRPTPLGGAFGGKLLMVEPLASLCALKLRRPVRLALTRMEDFATTNPAPAQAMELEAGAAPDGTFTALRGRSLADCGVHSDFPIESFSAMLACGPYRWQARDLHAYGVMTNRLGFGSYRAPGAPPAAFAIETLVDELAVALGVDPIELRLRNALVEGDRGPDGAPMPVFGAIECLERVRAHPLWARRGSLPADEGIGVALGWWPGGLEPATAACRLDSDGGLTVVTGAVDMSGTESGFAVIAAEAFGLPVERVRVVAADTASAGHSGVSGGSKITYTVGRAVQRAAEQARERLLAVAARELEIAVEDLEVAGDEVRPVGDPARALSIRALASKVLAFGSPYAPVAGHSGLAQPARAPSVAAHLSHVRVDRDTGRVELLDHVVIQDVGRALNPSLVEGQMIGGTVQGFGWALHEEMAFDENGQLRSGSFAEYVLPSADLVPPIQTEIVEVPAPDGPFGAKGIGEAPVVAVAAAIANAVFDAAGVRLRELPMTPEQVWSALSAPH